MMRVNLLGGTAEHRVAVQKTKVAARRGQQLFMLASALVIFVLAIGIDHLWTNNAQAAAQAELTREEEEARKLEADIQRKNELEAELKQVDERIKVIKQLRAEQKGPVAMLSAIACLLKRYGIRSLACSPPLSATDRIGDERMKRSGHPESLLPCVAAETVQVCRLRSGRCWAPSVTFAPAGDTSAPVLLLGRKVGPVVSVRAWKCIG